MNRISNRKSDSVLLGNLQSYRNWGALNKHDPRVCRFCCRGKSCSFVENGRFCPVGYRKKRPVDDFVADFVATSFYLKTMS